MSKEMEYIEALSEHIGPHPATSEAEYQAAEWIADQFSQHNLDPDIQNFNAPATVSWTYVLYGVLAVLAAGLSGLIWWLRPVSLVLSLVVAVLFYTDHELIWGFSRLFAKRPSQNVIARHEPRGGHNERSRKIVIVAHYDTPRSAAIPGFAQNTPILFTLTKWCTWIIPIFVLVQMVVGAPIRTWVWYGSFVPAAFLLVMVLRYALDQALGKDIPGVNDNASGVATMLSVLDKVLPAEEAGEEPTQRRSMTGAMAPVGQPARKSKEETFNHLYGREVIEDAGIAPSEAGLEYTVPVKSRLKPGMGMTGKMQPVEGAEAPAATSAPAGSGMVGKSEIVTPAPAAAPMDIPTEGFPIGLTADETLEPAPKPAEPSHPVAPIPSIESAPAVRPDQVSEDSGLSTDIPSIDDIAMPGATQAFAPVSANISSNTTAKVSDPLDMSQAFAPASTPAAATDIPQVESWESSLTVTEGTDEFTEIPDSRVRELGSQVTGIFGRILPGRKKKDKRNDEEEALGSWLDSGNKKKSRRDKDDSWGDDDDDFGWQGGVVPAANEDDLGISTEERIAAIKESVLSISDRDLLDKEVWFVATGAKETGAFGMQAFLDEYGSELRGALIVSIDSIGSGDLSWVASEGTVKAHSADRRLVVLARRIARSETLAVSGAKMRGVTTDALVALIKGYNAMAITAFDGSMPANYRVEDSVSDIDPENLEDAVKLVTGIIRES